MSLSPIRIAILDLYDGVPNMGMRCIQAILDEWGIEKKYSTSITIFKTRAESEIPGNEFDIYISSGGPGSPLDSIKDHWDNLYTKWLDKMYALHKPVLLICHSFQIACRHFDLGTVCLRRSRQIGILPVHTLIEDDLFNGLQETFYTLESRSYQIIAPNDEKIRAMNAKIMALEKMRPTVPLERAIMGIKFSEKMYGVQFHPEAALHELVAYFNDPSTKQSIIDEFSLAKWENIVQHLDATSPIKATYSHFIPNFLDKALKV
jgi:GMP synthase-like glutamine amidotransferase